MNEQSTYRASAPPSPSLCASKDIHSIYIFLLSNLKVEFKSVQQKLSELLLCARSRARHWGRKTEEAM